MGYTVYCISLMITREGSGVKLVGNNYTKRYLIWDGLLGFTSQVKVV